MTLTGAYYEFTPTSSDPNDDDRFFSYSEQDPPSGGERESTSAERLVDWASFNSKTGKIYGTPGVGDAGISYGISITVSDGELDATLTPAFSLVILLDSDGDGAPNDCDSGCAEAGYTADSDDDDDGLLDDVEATLGTNPLLADTDGDGFSDSEEVEAGTDPNDEGDLPGSAGLPIWLLYEASRP